MKIICCLKHGDLYGPEYVNILYDMVRRNIKEGTEGKFVCFTDNAEGLHPGIEIRSIPENLVGWWGKLYLFKNGLFPDGDRIFYMDLDTIISGSLDEIFEYKGDFAILRDFYRYDGFGSAIMSWQAGNQGHIWDNYAAAGYPSVDGGDQTFIESMVKNPDIWQDIYPDAFVSYKVHCKNSLPKGAKVICFHGLPMPHQVMDGFVPHIWKVGGGSSLEIEVEGNTKLDKIKENICFSIDSGLPRLERQMAAHDRHAVIVGGGPSINSHVQEIALRAHCGEEIIALNNSWRWLEKRDIKTNMQIMLDARPENRDFVPPSNSSILRLYSSQCDRGLIELSKNENVMLWDALIDEKFADNFNDRNMFWVGSGTTVGIRSILLLYVLGYRKFHIYGYDSCYEDNSGHAYEQPLNEGEKVIDVLASDKKFRAAPWMVTQVQEFLELMEFLTEKDCTFTIHGNGMLQHAVKTMLVERKEQPEIVNIDGLYWPSADRICRPSMQKTVDDIASFIMHTNDNKVAIQAGGNVGVFPKRLAKSFDTVYTFEPDSVNYKCLEMNCHENNIIKFNAALGEKVGKIGITKVKNNCGANFVEGDGDIPVMTIDGLELESCDLIQLDIEGYEMKALEGARETIKKHSPVIVIEDNGLSMKYNIRKGEVGEWLRQFGYKEKQTIHRDILFKKGE